jgi:hypothetical protein
MSAPSPRPRAVSAAFWCWLGAAMLLIVGGLIAASVHLPVIYRGAGIITVIAGAGMAFLAGRSRSGDNRFRRAAVAFSLAIVVLVALVSLFGVVHILTLIGVILLIVGTVLMTRPSTTAWYESGGHQ